jgi:hypothetical protein
MRIIKKFLIPHFDNNYHPYSTRHYTLILFSVLLLFLNFVVFPSLGVKQGNALALNYDLGELIMLANADRQKAGLRALNTDERLNRAALAKANDMLRGQYWSHFGPAGESPWGFIVNAGYDYVYAGENLAKDFVKPLETHLAWMKSPTHRANIMNANFKDIGVAILSGTLKGENVTLIVQMFGSENPTSVQSPPQQPPRPVATSTPQFTATPTPTPVPENPIKNYAPIITSPQDNFITNNSDIELRGNAEFGDKIKVFSNDLLIGELPKDQNNFTVRVELLDEKNNIFIKTKSTSDGAESLSSNNINIILDTTPPDAEKITVNYTLFNNVLNLNIFSEEDIQKITVFNNNSDVTDFTRNEFGFNYFNGNYLVRKINIAIYDQAGNRVTRELDLADSQAISISTSQDIGLSLSNLSFKLGQRELINISVISLILGLILLDASILLRNGFQREFAAHQGFHLALIIICIVGVVTI